MSIIALVAFASAMFVLAITPGPGVFATVARALASGFKPAAFVALGIVGGDLAFLLLAIYGLAALAENLHGMFLTIKYLGAAYLIYLGIQLWRQSAESFHEVGVEQKSWLKNLLTGFTITLSNPKVIVFYVSFLPTFLEVKSLSNTDVVSIATVLSLVLGSVMLFYGYSASKARKLFNNQHSQKRMNRTAGSAMIASGAVLAIKS